MRIVLVRRDLDPEGVAVLRGVLAARAVRDEEDRGRTRAADQPERALAERRRVDEQVAARAIEDDVLALVLEGLIQLEDPRAELVNVYPIMLLVSAGRATRRAG
ncbi:MAG TPA: hypothetical protein VIN70_00700 [Candidatus Limnocylindria bacterium]